LARKITPCVVFVDEVDALLDARSNAFDRASKVEVMNEFMAEWDGLLSNNQGVMVMAATNRPFVLDDAVLRRLPRRVLVDLPTVKGRTQILTLLLKNDPIHENVNISELAKMTELYSGSDLKNFCIAAAFRALRSHKSLQMDGRPVLGMVHFEAALNDVPASISDRMDTIADLRKWDQLYGEGRKKASTAFGFPM